MLLSNITPYEVLCSNLSNHKRITNLLDLLKDIVIALDLLVVLNGAFGYESRKKILK